MTAGGPRLHPRAWDGSIVYALVLIVIAHAALR